MTVCEERKGFRTCFIKYDHGKKVIIDESNLSFLGRRCFLDLFFRSKVKTFRWIRDWARLCHPGSDVLCGMREPCHGGAS